MDAIAACRKRCWEKDWVVDLDVKAFFDTVSWDLTMKAVTGHTDRKWVLLYVERWLKAPMQMPDGTVIERTRVRHKADRFHRCSLICSCITASICGCSGISGVRSSVSRTMR